MEEMKSRARSDESCSDERKDLTGDRKPQKKSKRSLAEGKEYNRPPSNTSTLIPLFHLSSLIFAAFIFLDTFSVFHSPNDSFL